ncbi:MAG: internal scaffolding protein [Microviridae sp.]|nr:MAG: internal scaffolding protein [Microviridae sp.]
MAFEKVRYIMYTVRVVGFYDSDAVSRETALDCPEQSRTHQEFKDESDINTIIDRFGIGENPIEAQKWVTNLDIADAPSNYQDVMNELNSARDQFMSLPAKVRSSFDNDPSQFVDFVSDPANIPEMIRLGLAVERVAPPPSDTDRIIAALKPPAQVPS